MTKDEAEEFFKNAVLHYGRVEWQTTAAGALVDKVRQAVMIEREACAQIVHDEIKHWDIDGETALETVEAAIRARP